MTARKPVPPGKVAIMEAVKEFGMAAPEGGLVEVRCPEPCGKMLGRFAGSGEIICPRCGRLVKWDME